MHHGTLPLGWVAVVFEELWPLFLVLVAILLWVFPDGRLPAGPLAASVGGLLVAGVLLGVAALGARDRGRRQPRRSIDGQRQPGHPARRLDHRPRT